MILRPAQPGSWQRLLAGWVLALCCAFAHSQNFVPVPPLKAHVTDQVGMLTPAQRSALDNVLAEYERRSGSQVAVLLLSSTAPEAIEQYGIRVAEAWKLGRKDLDDGVLLIVAKDNPPALRRLRIEAGRGVEGSLTDAQSKRILQDVIAPHFRQNDFYGGLVAGVGAITALLDQEGLPATQARQAPAEDEGSLFEFLLPLFFMLWIIVGNLRSRRRRQRLGHNAWGRHPGIIIGGLGSGIGSGGYRGGGGFGGGGYRGRGGGFGGGGASGNW